MNAHIEKLAREACWTGLYITWAEPTGNPNFTPYKKVLTVPVTFEQIEAFARLIAEDCAMVAVYSVDQFEAAYNIRERYK